MGNGFDAGSILVSLKANLDNFNAGINSAKETLRSLSSGGSDAVVAFKELDTAVVVFKEIETSSSRLRGVFNDLEVGTQRLGQTFQSTTKNTDQLEQTSTRANNTWARSANRIIGIQIALLSLSSTANGPLKESFQALSNGVAGFGAAMQLTQGRIGALNASILGAGIAAISFYSRSIEEGVKATDATTKSEIEARKSLTQLADAFGDAKLASSAFARTGLEDVKQKLASMQGIFAENLKKIRQLPDEIADIEQKLSAERGKPFYERSSTAVKQYTDQISALQYTLQNLKRTNDDIAKQAPFAKAEEDVRKLGEALDKINSSLQTTQDIGAKKLGLKVAQPGDVADANLAAARAKLDATLAAQEEFKRLSGNEFTDPAIRALAQSRLNSGDVSAATNQFKAALKTKEAVDAVNDLSKTFSTSVGDGLRDAILNAKKPMEALAGIGQNLFGNMIDQTVKRLETGLENAFKAITGAAGEGIGLAITGILGAAGAVLSRLGSKSSSSFNPVQSAVTSTQAFRGVVAGQSSVAIADVGDNLSRALAPMFEKQDATNGWLQKIESNTRRSGGGPGGFPAVAAPTA